MAKQYRLGTDDNMLEAYGVSFDLLNNKHYLDAEREKLFAEDIKMGRLILVEGAPEVADNTLNLPDINDYIVEQPSSSGVINGGTTGQVLTKTSDLDGDYAWSDANASGSATEEILSAIENQAIVDDDVFPYIDVSDEDSLKKSTWSNIKTLLSAIFVILGGKDGGQTITGGTLTTQRLQLRGNANDLTTGGVTILDTTDSTNASNGSLIVSGGIGISKNLWMGGRLALGNNAVHGYKLDIYASTDGDNGISIRNANTGTSSASRIAITDQNSVTQAIVTVPATTNTQAAILGTARAQGVFFYVATRHMVSGTLGAYDYIIGTNNIERMRVSSTGDVTIVGNITCKQSTVTVQTLTYATTVTPDFNLGQMATLTLTGVCVLANPTNVKVGSSMVIKVKQDATGARTMTYGSNIYWPNNVAPTLSTTANAVDLITLYSFDGITINATIIKGYTT